MSWETAARTSDRLGECPLWHPSARQLYWIDFYGPAVHRLDPASGVVETWRVAGARTIGSIALATAENLLLALDHGIVLFDPRSSHQVPFANPSSNQGGVSYNDGKVDRQGHFWIGTFDVAETEPRAGFYRLTGDGQSELADAGFIVCNGPAFSPQGDVLYLSDTMDKRILAYDVDPASGRLHRRRAFVSLAEAGGLPDGLAVDSAGCVWCALYGAGEIRRYAPDGTLLDAIACPARNVTSCCLGGEDLRTLYVTSGPASADDSPDDGGCLLARRVDCPGLPEPIFQCG